MPESVERTDPDGVDFGWVMQVTFVCTILVGAPVVALLSLLVSLSSWTAWAGFAVRVGALVWFLTAVSVYGYARWRAD
jgi:membrane protein YdbS with pleckstrin-like domain